MFDPEWNANAVVSWTDLGVSLPKPLTKAIDVYEAVRYAEVAHEPTFDAASVTAANAEERIREYAKELTLSLNGSAGQQSVLSQAKRHALQITARAVLARAGEAVPAVIEGLTPEFDEAVATFTEAVQNLPEDLTQESVIDGGPSVLSIYQTAREAAGTIHRIESWVESLSDLPGSSYSSSYQHGVTPKVLKVLAPETRTELSNLINVDQEGYGPLLTGLGAPLVYAAREGIAFKINTPSESAALLDELESQPVKSSVRHMRF